MDSPIVTVAGHASMEVEPETAAFNLQTTAVADSSAAALESAGVQTAALDGVLSRHGRAIEQMTRSHLWVREEREEGTRGVLTGRYVAGVNRSPVVGDLDVLGPLADALADLDRLEIFGPTWGVRPSSPVRRRVRERAVAEALHRAREYAQALGTDITALIELADAGLLSGTVNTEQGRLAGAMGRGSGSGVDFTPVPQTIRATVHARFRVGPPDLAAMPLEGFSA